MANGQRYSHIFIWLSTVVLTAAFSSRTGRKRSHAFPGFHSVLSRLLSGIPMSFGLMPTLVGSEEGRGKGKGNRA